MPESRLSRSDYEEFLIYCMFGSGTDYLGLCLKRAYLDFSRTMRGFRKFEAKQAAHAEARACLRKILSEVRDLKFSTQNHFDQWHRQSCEKLAFVYQTHGYAPFYVGQAQKWINMTFKYIFTMGHERMPGYDTLYPFCHVPLDNILVGQLAQYGFPALSDRWSRISNYDQYLSYQQWIRDQFQSLPLDVEFLLWMGKSPD